jgi:hypothetical protein
MQFYFNSKPIPKGLARIIFIDANPSMDQADAEAIFKGAQTSGGSKFRAHLRDYGLEVVL